MKMFPMHVLNSIRDFGFGPCGPIIDLLRSNAHITTLYHSIPNTAPEVT